MAQRRCGTPGCVKPHRARGLCVGHYNDQQYGPDRVRHPKVDVACDRCGLVVQKYPSKRFAKRYCSLTCRDADRPQIPKPPKPERVHLCTVSATHPSRRPRKPSFHAGYCAECGKGYVIASECVSTSSYCSKTCAKRVGKRARRAREHGASGTFTWDAFTKLTLALGNVCAYCGGDGPLEPDHVMPLSRHGHNGLTNILPSCRMCNATKRDLLPSQWVSLNRLRGRTVDLARFKHLTAHIFLAHHAA